MLIRISRLIFRSRKHRCWYMRSGILVLLFSLLKIQNRVSGDLGKLGNHFCRYFLIVFVSYCILEYCLSAPVGACEVCRR